jgi:glycosyltransferase involved in cell wall biosynthesis
LEPTPHISVIIPTLQEGKLLTSTLAQFTSELRTKHQLEIIVSDGGSTDETLSIARCFADVVVDNVHGLKQNISIGRNAGARAAKGNILLFINADTFIDDIGTFFSVIRRAAEQEYVAGVTCSVRVHADVETFADGFFHTIYNWYFWLLNVVGMGMGRGECQVVPRDLFLNIGGYNEEIAAGEDFDLFVRLRRLGKTIFLRSQTVRESPRRYRKYGYVAISAIWFINAIAVLLFRRSVTKEWKPIR